MDYPHDTYDKDFRPSKPLLNEGKKEEDKEDKRKTAVSHVKYSSKTTDVVIGSGATEGLPNIILEAISSRVREDSTTKYLTSLLKDPEIPANMKNDFSKTLCQHLLQKKTDPNLTTTLTWLEKNTGEYLDLDLDSKGIVFEGKNSSTSKSDNRHEESTSIFNQLITEKLRLGYEFKMIRANAKRLLIVANSLGKEKLRVQINTLEGLQRSLEDFLQAHKLNDAKVTVDEEADDHTLCIEGKDQSTINQVTKLLHTTAGIHISKTPIPQSFFKWPDATSNQQQETPDPEISVNCSIQ